MQASKMCAAIAVATVVAGCSMEVERAGVVASAILHGEPDTRAAHAGIVRLWIEEPGGDKWGCTGSFIAPRVVLTAAHCLEDEVAGIAVGIGADEDSADWHEAASWSLHPEFGFVPGTGVYINDIAIVRLASAPADVPLLAPLPPELALAAGEVGEASLEYVGYGLTETDDSGLRRAVTVPMAYLCDGPDSCTWWWDLFHYAVVAPRNICHRKQPAGTCSGDSGGPVLVRRGDTEYIAGVISWSNSGCKDLGCATKVDGFAEFLAEATAPSIGDECSGHADCGSAACVDGVCCATACEDACSSCALPGSEGSCVALDCDDGDPCTADACDADSGCSHDALPDGTRCDSAPGCGGEGMCIAGACSCDPDAPDAGAPGCIGDACEGDAAPAADEPESSGGCRVAAGRRSPSASALALIALAVVGTARRRRRLSDRARARA